MAYSSNGILDSVQDRYLDGHSNMEEACKPSMKNRSQTQKTIC